MENFKFWFRALLRLAVLFIVSRFFSQANNAHELFDSMRLTFERQILPAVYLVPDLDKFTERQIFVDDWEVIYIDNWIWCVKTLVDYYKDMYVSMGPIRTRIKHIEWI